MTMAKLHRALHLLPLGSGPGPNMTHGEGLGGAGHPIVVPRSSTPHCRGKPSASNVRHLDNFAAPGLRHHTVPGPAAPCWDTVLSLVLGRVLPRHQQYHPHQVTA
ncbi:hypothetical protein DQ04_11551050 [Trypanosoma grayi]|uniref:hypothetical protein n=1 Tax=Trypanosoma grayi TaxID=71804 RepID=UPI0004F41287|nr:hypothetical protein DQ04_11551050 [Trypanosoma grayi]KEG06947.1 hypothetical protein DQ04_11551050 [Trypanosoma grayi]